MKWGVIECITVSEIYLKIMIDQSRLAEWFSSGENLEHQSCHWDSLQISGMTIFLGLS